MTQGKLFGVSVGPGDPELLTLRAVRAIQEADVIAVPDAGHDRMTAYDIARPYVEGKRLLTCPTPMSHDEAVLAEAHETAASSICALLDEGLSVAYLCLGDVGVYSSFHYVGALVRDRGYDVQLIAGVTSFCAAAARLGMPLCSKDEPLVIVPCTSDDADELLRMPANKVLMKPGRDPARICQVLNAAGLLDGARMVERCGLPGERIYQHLEDVDRGAGYLSVILIPRVRNVNCIAN